ncbi:helix-turn-helix domain-containing protein [Sphingomonas corticis]|uniref:Helix-turn-helix transcriptional regulator n=1 Tax=Sphingomonas corticis TaxID=2722791 RepID=A0ABX1CQT1_9SPHN|nr:helix-turn-helix transcriptional regulator [Sphingomonas corticis]
MKSELQIEVGRRIRARREAAGVSQEEFARRTGLGRSFFGRIERGAQNVSLETLARIAVALPVDLGELLAGLPAAEAGAD